MQMVVHSADIANPAKPLRFSQQWVDRVLREFFAQVQPYITDIPMPLEKPQSTVRQMIPV